MDLKPSRSYARPFLIRQLFYIATLHKRFQFFVACHSHVELTRQCINVLFHTKYWVYVYKGMLHKPLGKILRSLDFG